MSKSRTKPVSHSHIETQYIKIAPERILDIELGRIAIEGKLPEYLAIDPPVKKDLDIDTNYALLPITISKWEKLWRQDRAHYVPNNPLEASGQKEWEDQEHRLTSDSHGKLITLRNQVIETGSINVPVFSLKNPKNANSLKIAQGRHRIVICRLLGLKYTYVAVPSNATIMVRKLGLVEHLG